MKILIRNGRVIDPASGRDETADVAIAAGRIVAIGQVPADFTPERTMAADGCVVAPGLVDLAARLKEAGPGGMESELAAAADGGVTSLVCPPDTDPPLDEPGLVDMLKFRARKLSRCRLFPLGALTQRLAGVELTEMIDLTEAGCVGFSQGEHPIKDNLTLMRAMQYASTHGYAVWLRPQEPSLSGGVAASGAVATRLGLSGVPVASETIALHTIIELVRQTGTRVHLCRLSSAAGVELVRRAKAEGLPVTADVSINSLHLTDVDIGYFNADMRLTPPLRQGKDRDALRAGLADGTIDALVSDHTPIGADDKMLPFGEAVPGATGLELLLSLALKWGNESKLSLAQALARVTSEPVRVLGEALGSLGQSAGRLVEGGVADICVFDPAAEWQVTPGALRSAGKHTPFDATSSGTRMPGRVRHTLVAGTLAFSASEPAPA
jgi:dihydroorotase